MNNCAKYANAQKITLSLNLNGQFSTIILEDDGPGFDMEIKSKGRGLTNMNDRARRIGARLIIDTSAKGTKIQLQGIPHIGEELKQEVQ